MEKGIVLDLPEPTSYWQVLLVYDVDFKITPAMNGIWFMSMVSGKPLMLLHSALMQKVIWT